MVLIRVQEFYILIMDEQPMSYLLFKLNMEMNYQDTFEKDEKVQKKYEEYLGIERSKKKSGEIIPACLSLKVKS